MTNTTHPLLRELLPDIFKDLLHEFTARGEQGLVDQLLDVRVVEPCPCSDDFCASFSVAERPTDGSRPLLQTLEIPSTSDGMLNVDITEERVLWFVEVLFRPDVRRVLHGDD